MIRPLDGLLIARAKLKTRRIRLAVTVIISSLLFSGLMFLSLFINGIVQSIGSFNEEGLGSRYIVTAAPIIDTSDISGLKAIDELAARQEQIIKDKKAAAKKLGIEYDAAQDPLLPISCVADATPCPNDARIVNVNSPVATAYAKERLLAIKDPTTKLREIGKKYDLKAVYRSSGTYTSYGAISTTSSIRPVKDGVEQEPSKGSATPKGFDTIQTLGWNQFNSALLEPFIIAGQNLKLGKDGSVPVIVPVSVGEQVAGLSELPSTATTQQRLDRIKELRSTVAGKTTQLCYRNQTSSDLYTQAKDQARQIAANKDKKDYVAPTLQYAVPSDTCGAVTIKKDTRNDDEKRAAGNELSFQKQFGMYQDPVQSLITVRIVGLTQDVNYEAGFSVSAIVNGFLRSTIGNGWFTPSEVITPDSPVSNALKPASELTPLDSTYYAEFSTAAKAKAFAKDQTCPVEVDYMSYRPGASPNDSRAAPCNDLGKYFDVMPFGSSSVALDEFKTTIWKFMRYVVVVIMAIAALILMGIVGKIIADSRRETAVFRALGATRLSIAQIYLTYSVLVAILISVMSLIIGGVTALWINGKFSGDATVEALVAFNAQDFTKTFSFAAPHIGYILAITGIIAVTALISTLIPLLTNVRRNPIRDMRDDS